MIYSEHRYLTLMLPWPPPPPLRSSRFLPGLRIKVGRGRGLSVCLRRKDLLDDHTHVLFICTCTFFSCFAYAGGENIKQVIVYSIIAITNFFFWLWGGDSH